MQIIKLDATQSTNTYLKDLSLNRELGDFTVVTTKNQTLGRGQLNAKWESEPGKNLAFSVLKKNIELPIQRVFLVSVCVSLAIIESLKDFEIPDLRIKWPNDILSGNRKIGGILIENVISGSKIKQSIIGFGLNVNQKSFKNAPHASSLENITGVDYNLDEVFYSVIEHLHQNLIRPFQSMEEELFKQYHTHLFKIGQMSSFRDQNDKLFQGTIQEVSIDGYLLVKHENGDLHEYGLKEIQLLY
ncbi:biotin--[acetyl-CoA-carboxylase] ligase [Maribacter ulvicola]|uniref:BirA family transcriptional regulator, biotin operon repressor / biotin-[acetyl-CoA-carboxylase] ligase n=1 Tax=Maribacter ulvicola TaxID=228959 RepID=A0A1N7A9P8_9FLAO|nr:biotin--[acetyl-CoA-carboxylase] ligase [Maribacter ulvicola]SIR35867.1 BirA family transcriptional regulator, biotin operon repressor / biotin-[acetyl-CoA-carboxylase] ligase [Maribacter ulvicola]